MKKKGAQIRGMLEGRSVWLIGGGTSMAGIDLSKLDNEFTIAINHSIEHYQNADALLFGDKIFLSKTSFDLKSYEGMIFCSEKCTKSKPIDEMLDKDNVFIFEDRRDEPTLNPRVGLFHPTSSGILALNLAIQMKAKKIYLLGYDYHYSNGKVHYYDDLEHHVKYPMDRLPRKAAKFVYFERWKERIFNLSTTSIITTFQKRDWRDYGLLRDSCA